MQNSRQKTRKKSQKKLNKLYKKQTNFHKQKFLIPASLKVLGEVSNADLVSSGQRCLMECLLLSGVSKSGLHRLRSVHAQSSRTGTTWGGLQTGALLEVHHWGCTWRFQKPTVRSSVSLFLLPAHLDLELSANSSAPCFPYNDTELNLWNYEQAPIKCFFFFFFKLSCPGHGISSNQ